MEAPPPPYSAIDTNLARNSRQDHGSGPTSPSPSNVMTPINEVNYEQLFRRETSTINSLPQIPTCTTLTFIDFLPLVCDRSSHVENFRDLVHRANSWLLTAPGWEVVSCESFKQWIEYDATSPNQGSEKLIYYEKSKKENAFFYGLRLWILPRESYGQPQTLDYINIMPKPVTRTSTGARSSSKVRMQTLKEAFVNFRTQQEEQPIPGRIISTQTLKMSVQNINNFDCENLLWQDEPLYDYQFMCVIRIFFETGEPRGEILGAMDFFPLSDIKLFGKDKRESVGELVSRAFKTLYDEHENDEGFRLLNIQTLETAIRKGKKTDTSILANKEDPKKMEHARYLRAVYVKNSPEYESSNRSAKVTCKTFLPVVLPDSESALKLNVETVEKTKERIEAWIKATSCKVVSCETVNLRSSIYQDYNALQKVNKCLPCNEYRWVTSFRLYIEGELNEPPASLLPALPKYDDEKCIIS